MPPLTVALLLLFMAYLLGSLPVGYVIGRIRGVNLFEVGSGNIGATNAGRVLGRPYGVLVFVLDFLKGALPVAFIVPIARSLSDHSEFALGHPDVLRVLAAALAFLGHLFPIYLGFRGGKGVATGAGAIFGLVPGSVTLAMLSWIVVMLASRLVSLASLVAVTILVISYLIGTPQPWHDAALPVTLYVVLGTLLVVLKHRTNLRRLIGGTESLVGEFAMREPVLRMLHVLVLGFWFGGAAFFNFAAAPAIFASFKEVVFAGPSDRTAFETLIAVDAPEERKNALASALAGTAVGPVFPKYFAMQTICGVVALITALSWWNLATGRRINRWRVLVIGVALATVVAGWPISNYVSELRVERFTSATAKAAFGPWHLVSLFLSFVTVCLAGLALALAAFLPDRNAPA